MTEIPNNKQHEYDLEKRTLEFAKRVNAYVRKLPRTVTNVENGKQLVRSGGSPGANYIEANEALSQRDFRMRIRICRKEVKECRFWTDLTEPINEELKEKEWIINESTELLRIFSSILENSKSSHTKKFD